MREPAHCDNIYVLLFLSFIYSAFFSLQLLLLPGESAAPLHSIVLYY
jgi:hypothetical protein